MARIIFFYLQLLFTYTHDTDEVDGGVVVCWLIYWLTYLVLVC